MLIVLKRIGQSVRTPRGPAAAAAAAAAENKRFCLFEPRSQPTVFGEVSGIEQGDKEPGPVVSCTQEDNGSDCVW